MDTDQNRADSEVSAPAEPFWNREDILRICTLLVKAALKYVTNLVAVLLFPLAAAFALSAALDFFDGGGHVAACFAGFVEASRWVASNDDSARVIVGLFMGGLLLFSAGYVLNHDHDR